MDSVNNGITSFKYMARQPRVKLQIERFRSCTKDLSKGLVIKLKTVEDEGFKVAWHPEFGSHVMNILHGGDVEGNIERLATGQHPGSQPFLKALLEFNLSLDRKCNSQGIPASSYTIFIEPGEILRAMALKPSDCGYLFELYRRGSRNPLLKAKVIEAFGYTFSANDKGIYGFICGLFKNISKDPVAWELRESIKYAREMLEDRKKEEDDRNAKIRAEEATRIKKEVQKRGGVEGDILAKLGSVRREARILMLQGGKAFRRRIHGVILGFDPIPTLVSISRIRNAGFNPFLRSLLDLNLAISRKQSSDPAGFAEFPWKKFPRMVPPVIIFNAMHLRRDDRMRQEVEKEGRLLISSNVGVLGRQIMEILRGDDPSHALKAMTENSRFIPFLKAFLVFHLELRIKFGSDPRWAAGFSVSELPYYSVDPAAILGALFIKREDDEYLMDLYKQGHGMEFNRAVLSAIGRNFSAGDEAIFNFIKGEYAKAEKLKMTVLVNYLKRTLVKMVKAKDYEDESDLSESVNLAEIDRELDKEAT